MNIKLILYENIPCWHELSWIKSPPALVLSIHKDFINSKVIDLERAPITMSMIERLQLRSFKGNFNEDIGFGGIFKRLGERGGFIRFAAKIPQVKKMTGGKCADCKGTGKREWGGSYEKCLFCSGTGKDWTMDWKDALAISASLTVLTTWLQYCEIETSAPYPQLMTLQTITQEGPHGGSLSGDISIPMYSFLKTFGDYAKLPESVQAMRVAHNKMVGSRGLYKYGFESYVQKGMFIISCPGDACSLNPSNWYSHEGEGYEYSCHNVDSAIQQITLLAGLSVLHDMTRKNMAVTRRDKEELRQREGDPITTTPSPPPIFCV